MGYYRSFMHTLRNPKDHAISSRLGGRTMETPERQKRCDNDFIPRRLLCATENPATGNETMTLPVSACNAGKLSREFYEVVLQEEKHFPSSDMAVDVSPSLFLDATCSISELYTVEDSLIINGLLIGTGNPADLQNSNHLLLIELRMSYQG